MKKGFIILLFCLTLISANSYAGELELMSHLDEGKDLLGNDVYSALPEEGWGVFIATGGGLQVFLEYTLLPIFQGMGAVDMAKDPAGTLWVRTDRGLIYRVDSEAGLWTADPFESSPHDRRT